jgi:indolepyruvate ferredoxin oxidoreductase, alpha subunit
MKKMVLLGDEAIAQAAMDAGLSGIYAYPGTPSTEITEYVQFSKQAKSNNIRYSWCANEKTAMEAALGMSYAGLRTMTCMKHVGLNVAADPFINSAITGANGGLVVVAADDPSMHSSQNEQDSRFFGSFAFIPILEPSDQQEAYDITRYGFDLSEKYEIPVLVRITTRLAHSRANVSVGERMEQNKPKFPQDPIQYVLMPFNARKRYKLLLDKQPDLELEAENSPFNKYIDGADKSLGIIVSGIAYNYLIENFPEHNLPHPVLKISQYPLPKRLIERLADECDEIMVIEEGYPLIEDSLRGLLGRGLRIRGRSDGSIPRVGELNPAIVGKAFGIEYATGEKTPELIVNRPPSLCQGCPHTITFNALNEALKDYPPGRVLSDIGCYTLGALPPFNSINSCVDMGASITMAKGAADAGVFPVVAVIGDSTFTHSGITGLLDAVNDKAPITVIIADNFTTAMTGGQFSPGTGKIEDICRAVGVEEEHIRIFEPHNKIRDKIVEIINEELHYKGVSVIIPRRECLVTLTKRAREEKQKQKTNVVSE